MSDQKLQSMWGELASCVSKDSPILDDIAAVLRTCGSLRSYFVRPETVFDRDSVFDSVGVFMLTDTHLIIVVSDVNHEMNPAGELVTITQVVELSHINDFQIGRRRVLEGPERGAISAVHFRFRWGGSWAADIRPAACDDPHCEADHGFLGSFTGEDGEIVLDGSISEATFIQGLEFIDELTRRLSTGRTESKLS